MRKKKERKKKKKERREALLKVGWLIGFVLWHINQI